MCPAVLISKCETAAGSSLVFFAGKYVAKPGSFHRDKRNLE